MVFSAIVLGGGGMKGIVMLGALYHFELTRRLNVKYIHTYVGTSVGGMLCVLLAAGYHPSELITLAVDGDIDISKMISIGPTYMISKLNELLKKKMQINVHNITLGEFKQLTKRTVRLVATCLNSSGHMFIMDYEKCPDMPLVLAVEATTSIPLLFNPVTYKNHILIDGVLSCNFPIHLLDMDNNNTLAISFRTAQGHHDDCVPGSNMFTSFIQAIMANFNATNDEAIETITRKFEGKISFLSLESELKALTSNLTKTQKYNAIKSGYFQASMWDKRNTHKHIRRRSCDF